MQVKLTIPGRPITKKNSQQIYRRGRRGTPFLVQSDAYQNYETACLWRLKNYDGPAFDGPVLLCTKYYMPNRRSWPDLMGLIQATADILEKAGIIEDDQQVKRLDGTEIVGVDRDNPRAEVLIEEWTDD